MYQNGQHLLRNGHWERWLVFPDRSSTDYTVKKFQQPARKRLTDALKYVSQCRSLAKAKASYQGNELTAFKKTLSELAALGINPVTIPREWNIKHIPNFLKAYFDGLAEDLSNHNILNENLCVAHGYTEYCRIFRHSSAWCFWSDLPQSVFHCQININLFQYHMTVSVKFKMIYSKVQKAKSLCTQKVAYLPHLIADMQLLSFYPIHKEKFATHYLGFVKLNV